MINHPGWEHWVLTEQSQTFQKFRLLKMNCYFFNSCLPAVQPHHMMCSRYEELTFGAHPSAICEAWQSIPSRGPAEEDDVWSSWYFSTFLSYSALRPYIRPTIETTLPKIVACIRAERLETAGETLKRKWHLQQTWRGRRKAFRALCCPRRCQSQQWWERRWWSRGRWGRRPPKWPPSWSSSSLSRTSSWGRLPPGRSPCCCWPHTLLWAGTTSWCLDSRCPLCRSHTWESVRWISAMAIKTFDQPTNWQWYVVSRYWVVQ